MIDCGNAQRLARREVYREVYREVLQISLHRSAPQSKQGRSRVGQYVRVVNVRAVSEIDRMVSIRQYMSVCISIISVYMSIYQYA
jgi:hypothetical protein